MQRTSPAAFITLKVDVTVNFRPSLSQTRLPLRFSCNTPRSLPAACRTCRFSARCRTSSPRRWAEHWWWRRRPWMRPHRDLEPRSHTAHGKHAAKRPRHRFQGFRDFVLREKKPLNLDQKKLCFRRVYHGAWVWRRGDRSDRWHAGLMHVAVILLLLLHLDALMVRSREHRSWVRDTETQRERGVRANKLKTLFCFLGKPLLLWNSLWNVNNKTPTVTFMHNAARRQWVSLICGSETGNISRPMRSPCCEEETKPRRKDTRSFSAAAVPEVRGQRADRLSLAEGERLLGVLPAQPAVSSL